MEKSNITFVTSFIDIYGETTIEDKTIEWRFQKFRDIASTGIQICIYACGDCEEYLQKYANEFPNIKIMKPVCIQETHAYKTCQLVEYSLPDYRNQPKDIPEYMMLINSKCEFMKDAIEQNPWNSSHFAWIDFSISYVFHDKIKTLEYLRVLSTRHLEPEFLVIPGCWDKIAENDVSQLVYSVYWRYCGGFLLGDSNSVLILCNLYEAHFEEFLKITQKLVWEVNFWAWLEANKGWQPRWYKADHNDCIIHIPADVCALRLDSHLQKTVYPYPRIETYEADSASYVFYKGKHVLNTRYVNYWYLESGHCSIKHPEDFIISKNLVSILDDNLEPTGFTEMREETVGLPSKRCYFYGLEDIRLYTTQGASGTQEDKLKFIATNIDYSPTGSNRMIVGEYDPFTQSYSNCATIEPPYESWCEKNWIPLVKHQDQDQDKQEYFIYKWNPMEIGRINSQNRLEIVKTFPILSPWFQRVRGSTVFQDRGDYLVGIVHFSEDTLPRRYYHVLVALDRDTFQPVKYSNIFVFQHIGIEFCIGIHIKEDKYVFWISKKDRDPVMVSIPVDKIPLIFDFI